MSGLRIESSLLHSTPVGAAALNGGDFGVEASPIAVVVCLAGAAALLLFAARRNQVVSFREARAHIASLREKKI